MTTTKPNGKGSRKTSDSWTPRPSFQNVVDGMHQALYFLLEQIFDIESQIIDMERYISKVKAKYNDPEFLKAEEGRSIRIELLKIKKSTLKNKECLNTAQIHLNIILLDLIGKEQEIRDENVQGKKILQCVDASQTGSAGHSDMEEDACRIGSAGQSDEGSSLVGSAGQLEVDEAGSAIGSAGYSDVEKNEGASSIGSAGQSDFDKGASGIGHSGVKKLELDLEAKVELLRTVRTKLENVQDRKNSIWMKNENLLQRLDVFLMEKGLNLGAEESSRESRRLRQAGMKDI